MVICLKQGADLHMAQLMLLPLTVCCISKIQIGFTLLVPAHPGNPRQRAVKWVCVCVLQCHCHCTSASFCGLILSICYLSLFQKWYTCQFVFLWCCVHCRVHLTHMRSRRKMSWNVWRSPTDEQLSAGA